ncbi:MAG TPA: hypothetical protein VII99_16505, partial [Bacteroidia bacterium]
ISILFGSIGFCSLLLVYIMEQHVTVWGMEQFSLFSIFPISVFFFLFYITKIKKNIIDPKSDTVSTKGLAQHAEKHLS